MQLQGVRVVDLTRIISGPFCSMFLADMGAEVIKIEDVAGGDPIRAQGEIVGGMGHYFASYNRNKKSLTLNLRHADGMAVLRKLIATAVEIAALPASIRGYGHVKRRNLDAAKLREAELLERFRAPAVEALPVAA